MGNQASDSRPIKSLTDYNLGLPKITSTMNILATQTTMHPRVLMLKLRLHKR